jgi:hypothetical protein
MTQEMAKVRMTEAELARLGNGHAGDLHLEIGISPAKETPSCGGRGWAPDPSG